LNGQEPQRRPGRFETLHRPLASSHRQMRILGPVGVPWQGASFSPVEIRAGKLSLQPEAIGADQEATNDLKHFDRKAP